MSLLNRKYQPVNREPWLTSRWFRNPDTGVTVKHEITAVNREPWLTSRRFRNPDTDVTVKHEITAVNIESPGSPAGGSGIMTQMSL
jgi:hypothetical protein